ncbi:MAG: GNAT family N-acetyltransferase [Alphaproteobacteria bacterium]|nr:GNAT family N-acetyltransferase [Alphaproteobacteria bacterium]
MVFKLQIVEAENDPVRLAQVAGLLRDYFLWLRRRYVKLPPVLEALSDEDAHRAELADLAGHYRTIVLALVDGIPAGCVMMRRLDTQSCEMKRLFVRPAFQGHGIAHALICRLAADMHTCGYRAMRLETGPLQYEAQTLYAALGFARIAPYYDAKPWARDNALFYEGVPADIAAVAGCRKQLRTAA